VGDFCRRSQNKQTKRLVCEFFLKIQELEMIEILLI